VSIEKRPPVVDEKNRIGDWEIDTIIGKDHKQAIVTVVERVSKKLICQKVEIKTAAKVSLATINGLIPFAEHVLTITGDNGSEFAGHEIISKKLNTDFYFAHPYSSWERGLSALASGPRPK
jgi:transposase, IS30 family